MRMRWLLVWCFGWPKTASSVGVEQVPSSMCDDVVAGLRQEVATLQKQLADQSERLQALEQGMQAQKKHRWVSDLRMTHLARALSHVADPRPRNVQAGSRFVPDPSASACPSGSFPLETTTVPSYKLCVRHDADTLEATTSVFGRWYEAEEVLDYFLISIHKKGLSERVVFVDVGANIGAVALFMGVALRDAGYTNVRIIAVEAEPQTASLLRAGVSLNKLQSSVEVVEAAASSSNGWVDFARFQSEVSRSLVLPPETSDARLYAGLQDTHADEMPFDKFEVRAMTLQSIIGDEPQIDFIKLDVEAHELQALYGLGHKLLMHTQAVMFECRAWAYDHLKDYGDILLTTFEDANHYVLCPGRCKRELETVLRPEEARPQFMNSVHVHRDEFTIFAELAFRLRWANRDFNALALNEKIAQDFQQITFQKSH